MEYKELKTLLLKNKKTKAEYEALEPEYQLVCEMLRCRQEQKMTQQCLSDITGIDRSDISKLENGCANPSLKTIKKIADGLGKRVVIKFL